MEIGLTEQTGVDKKKVKVIGVSAASGRRRLRGERGQNLDDGRESGL